MATNKPNGRVIVIRQESVFLLTAGLLFLASGFLVALVYRSYAWSAFFAVLFYVGFERVNLLFLRLFRSRTASAAASTLTVIIVFILPAYLILQHLIREVLSFIIFLRDHMNDEQIIETALKFPYFTDLVTSNMFFWIEIQNFLLEYAAKYEHLVDPNRVAEWMSSASYWLVGGVTFTVNAVLNLMFGIILLFSMFHEGHRFNLVMQNIMPLQADLYRTFIQRMKEIIWAVLVGNFFVSILQGAAITFGLLIAGVPSPVLWGVIAAVFSLVPVVGTGVIWLPAALYMAFIEDSYSYGIFLLIYGPGMYLILENIVKPLIMNRKVGMHPLFLFLAIIGGIKEFGLSGVFLGPLVVTVFLTLWTIVKLWLQDNRHQGNEAVPAVTDEMTADEADAAEAAGGNPQS